MSRPVCDADCSNGRDHNSRRDDLRSSWPTDWKSSACKTARAPSLWRKTQRSCLALCRATQLVGPELEFNLDLSQSTVDDPSDIDAHLHEVRTRFPGLTDSGGDEDRVNSVARRLEAGCTRDLAKR